MLNAQYWLQVAALQPQGEMRGVDVIGQLPHNRRHVISRRRRDASGRAFTEKRLPLCQKLRAPPRYTEIELQGWNLKEKKFVQTTKRVFSFFWPPPLSNSTNHQDQQLNQLNVVRPY